MRIAVLHNPRPDATASHLPDDFYEEYDSAETIAAICAALAGLRVEPVPVIADRELPRRLEDGRFDFAFNIAEGAGRRCREALSAAVCEMLGLPFTGSDALTLAAAQDKAIARRIVAPDLPVPPACLVDGEPDMQALDALAYPVIVKPNDEGSSKGIGPGSRCRSPGAAAERCRWLRARYGAPALVETFLPGMEVTVGIRGNGPDRRVLAVMEIAPRDAAAGAGPFLYDIDAKRDWRRAIAYHVPARLPAETLHAIERHALKACDLLGCRDIARIDFRLDAAGQPFFLECNPLPGLNPEHGDIVILSRGVAPYADLVQGILLDAAKRIGFQLGR
jgi:D-alanine-D-alanine ligase